MSVPASRGVGFQLESTKRDRNTTSLSWRQVCRLYRSWLLVTLPQVFGRDGTYIGRAVKEHLVRRMVLSLFCWLPHQVYMSVGTKIKADLLTGNAVVLFAYGLSGSGKTFTVFGPDAVDEPEVSWARKQH